MAPEVLSKAFFQAYDDLEPGAAGLEAASASLMRAKAEREAVMHELSREQRNLRSTRAMIREQRGRIELVSKHWFYGTTIFQPQLWLRGGCKGKIKRARTKLVKAQEVDLPHIQSLVEKLQMEKLPQLEMKVKRQFEYFDFSENAASEREMMRQRAYQEHPTELLKRLRSQEERICQRRNEAEVEAANLEDVISKLFRARDIYQKSRVHFDEAVAFNSKLESVNEASQEIPKPLETLRTNEGLPQTETLVSDGSRIIIIDAKDGPKDIFHLDKSGKMLTSNFPCPNGCGYLVTWHQTHCCGDCKALSGEHGPRCGRKALSSQLWAQDKLRALEQNRETREKILNRMKKNCNRSFADGRTDMKQAERLVASALHEIAASIRERHASLCTALTSETLPSTPHGGSSSTANRRVELLEWLEIVDCHQTELSKKLSALQQMQTSTRRESAKIQESVEATRAHLKREQNRIFDDLRSRVLADSISMENDENLCPPPGATHAITNQADVSIPLPSAPSGVKLE